MDLGNLLWTKLAKLNMFKADEKLSHLLEEKTVFSKLFYRFVQINIMEVMRALAGRLRACLLGPNIWV